MPHLDASTPVNTIITRSTKSTREPRDTSSKQNFKMRQQTTNKHNSFKQTHERSKFSNSRIRNRYNDPTDIIKHGNQQHQNASRYKTINFRCSTKVTQQSNRATRHVAHIVEFRQDQKQGKDKPRHLIQSSKEKQVKDSTKGTAVRQPKQKENSNSWYLPPRLHVTIQPRQVQHNIYTYYTNH